MEFAGTLDRMDVYISPANFMDNGGQHFFVFAY